MKNKARKMENSKKRSKQKRKNVNSSEKETRDIIFMGTKKLMTYSGKANEDGKYEKRCTRMGAKFRKDYIGDV